MYDVYCDRPSKSARLLARALGGSRIRNPEVRNGHRVVNWGTTSPWPAYLQDPINRPGSVRRASNKLSFFQTISAQPYCPPFTTNREIAEAWLQDDFRVVCRTLLNSSSGRGIHIANFPDDLIDAPLYVKYIPKQDEFRVHIFDGHIIDIQRKARLRSVQNPNWRIRNLANGFIYAREGIEDYPHLLEVREVALGAYDLTELDFGAFDVIVNRRTVSSYVLEVNTAPGLMGTTLERYVSHLQNRNQ